MTTPDVGEHPAAAKTFDEIEAEVKAREGQGPDLTKIKLEGEGVPDEMKGKTLAETIEDARKLKDALKLSEEARAALGGRVGQLEARQAAEEALKGSGPPKPSPETTVPSLTEAELVELHQNEPLKAIQYMQEEATQKVMKNLDNRLSPLMEGTASGAETRAKEKYKEEFGLFGDQIEVILNKLPTRSAMSSDKAWDDIVAYVSGQPANREVLFKKQIDAALAEREGKAHVAADVASGGDLTHASQQTPPVKTVAGELDATQKEIARTLGLTEVEYKQWSQ